MTAKILERLIKFPTTMSTRVYALALSMILSYDTFCTPVGDYNVNLTRKCKYASDAIDRLRHKLPSEMTLEDKCKRYAVITSIINSKGRRRRKVEEYILRLTEDQVYQLYRRIDPVDLGQLFMNAIDGFRISQLGPALFDIVKCLERVDTQMARTYLKSPELNIILELYRHVLQSPDAKIDLNSTDLPKDHSLFSESLKNLFGKYLLNDPSSMNQDKSRVDGCAKGASNKAGLPDLPRLFEHREQERLRQQRIKLLQPEAIRERARIRQQNRRKRLRQLDQQTRETQLGAIKKAVKPHRSEPKPVYPSASRPLVIPGESSDMMHGRIGSTPETEESYLDIIDSMWIEPTQPELPPFSQPERVPFRPPDQPMVGPMATLPSHSKDVDELPARATESSSGSFHFGETGLEQHFPDQKFNYLPDPVDEQSADLTSLGPETSIGGYLANLNDTETIVKSFLNQSP